MENILKEIPEIEIKEALLHEYKRKLLLYRMIDSRMTQKYNMSFANFDKTNVVKNENHSWNVESDAMEWEHAQEGIQQMTTKIFRFQ